VDAADGADRDVEPGFCLSEQLDICASSPGFGRRREKCTKGDVISALILCL